MHPRVPTDSRVRMMNWLRLLVAVGPLMTGAVHALPPPTPGENGSAAAPDTVQGSTIQLDPGRRGGSAYVNVEAVCRLVERLLHDARQTAQTPDPRSLIDCAVQTGSPDIVRTVLDHSGRNIRSPDVLGHGLLRAIELEDVATAQALLAYTPDLWRRNRAYLTPLELAHQQGLEDLARRLLAGYESRGGEPFGRSVLHLGVLRGNLGFVRFCLESGAQVNALDQAGCSPLDIAARYQHEQPEFRRLLEAHGGVRYCKESIYASRDEQRLDEANRLDLALYELGASGPSEGQIDRNRILVTAVSLGHAAAVEMLLLHGADPNNRQGGLPVLHMAAMRGCVRCVRLLLDGGADPHMRSEYSLLAIHEAVWPSGNAETIRLLAPVSDINAPSSVGTPLYQAVGFRNLEAVRTLLALGADPNRRTGPGETALHRAVEIGDVTVVRALLEGGADVSARDSMGRTPLDSVDRASPVAKQLIGVLRAAGGGD